jgi:hypothetical protein
MINAASFKVCISFGFKKGTWVGVAMLLFSSGAWAQTQPAETYPVNGVWIARDDHFPGSASGACLILKEFGVDAILTQPFPSVVIFSKGQRFEVRKDRLTERRIRSVKNATDGAFQITESLGKHWLPFSKRQSFTLTVIDPTTIEITDGKVRTQFSKCSSTTPSL